MSLSCLCSATDDFAWYWEPGSEFSVLDTQRARRCCSCGELIAVGADCVKHQRYRPPKNEIERRIYGDEYDAVSLPPKYHCERCGGLFFSFFELGFECVLPDENMVELTKEYHLEYGPKQAGGESR